MELSIKTAPFFIRVESSQKKRATTIVVTRLSYFTVYQTLTLVTP